MNNQTAVSLVTELTADSSPSISEIVELFQGLQVKSSLRNFVRVTKTKYSDTPLVPGTNSSRFSVFGNGLVKVTYGAKTIETAIYETIVRTRFDINPRRILKSEDYEQRSAVVFSNKHDQELNLLDLTNGNATCYGVPTDVIRSSDHTEGQHFSHFVYSNMANVDGFIYSSRFTTEECVALYYDRAVSKLNATIPVRLKKSLVEITMASKNIRSE